MFYFLISHRLRVLHSLTHAICESLVLHDLCTTPSYVHALRLNQQKGEGHEHLPNAHAIQLTKSMHNYSQGSAIILRTGKGGARFF